MHRNNNHPTIVTIEKVIDETPTVRTLVFSDEIMSTVLPGQFAMVWIPGVNELPMSIMISKEFGKAAFTVRKHGPASTGLFNIKVGEQIGIRGPYGNSFDIKEGKLLLVGGGTGLVPMMRLLTFVKPTDDVTLLIGAKSKDEVFFESLANGILENNTHKVIVSTDDGSYGEKGFVTDLVEKLVNDTHFDAVYVCGPEIMMYKTVQSANTKGIFV
ncbi:MAG: dihydroorotate dehydrogenase electron transfer subunit, partial [Nitrosopumilus sp.]